MATGSDGITRTLVEFISSARLDAFPANVVEAGKRCVIDGIGVMLAGSTTPAGAVMREHVRAIGGTPEASVLGVERLRAPATLAALANGTSGHAMDFDDTQLSHAPDRIFGLLTHPTVPPLAALLALGERAEVSGAAFLGAFLTGFEVECKIAEAIDPNHYGRGFHTSGTVGTFGAAAGAAKLLGLESGAVAHTLGIAASLSSGIRVNFGTMTKPLHVGRAAENGVVAADLAARGFTAAPEALDGPWGFFQVFGGGFDPDRVRRCLGNPYAIISPGVSMKPYPCGVLGHPSMDAMLKLVVDHDLEPTQIRTVRLRAGSNILKPLRYRRATNELEAKFCPAFMLASIALRRRAGIREFSDEFVASEPVQRMMDKIETILDPEIEAQGFDRIRSSVEVELEDGRCLRQAADERHRGGPDRPFTEQELFQKFTECAELVLPPPKIQQALDLLGSLETLSDVRALVRTLS